ncbi:putative methyltransferase-like protein 25 [Saccoglossus kowalevskii]|uniref:Methyltransferase-like protein 25-like n=1 Tax=Saccoglossus kowalevskii TaxID=10224 RepID=A0ABM0MP48_SACKO|nr:PREDICTED: methyltransferase-like protein 25-like [Saccoglossus kowalevskii]
MSTLNHAASRETTNIKPEVEKQMENIYMFLEPHLTIANVNTVGFFTEQQWLLLSDDIRHELLSMNDQQLALLPTAGHIKDDTLSCPQLQKLVESSQNFQIEQLGFVDNIDDIVGGCDTDDVLKPGQFMSLKKLHEVSLMSNVVNRLATSHGVKQVIDIGSGKGYLSQHLSLQYGLNVIGIDSANINTTGALERNRKIKKFWPGLHRKANVQKSPLKTDESMVNKLGNDVMQIGLIDSTVSKMVDCQVEAGNLATIGDADGRGKTVDLKHAVVSAEIKDKMCSFRPVTAYVDTQTQITSMFEDGDNIEDLLVTGLHTCGDLSACILRMFTHDDSVKILCNVGCCYHLISEKFEDESERHVAMPTCISSSSDSEYGFPMSDVLRRKEATIGRSARMLSCLSVDRIESDVKLPSQSLFYRAVLQVIIQQHYTLPTRQQRVGKIAAKCKTFVEYVRKSLKKLHYDENKLSDDEITEYYNKYSQQERYIECFTQYKAIFAPIIESLIILDRFAYLLQQDDICEAHIVKLFDPVISPRCFALIALKK